MDKFFISGLQRTGTNFTQSIFNQNIDCKVSWEDVYWKHEIVVPESIYFKNKKVNGVIVVVKNPYQWIESICFRNCVDIYERYGVDYRMNDKTTMYFTKNDKCFNVKSLISLYTTFYTNWALNSRYDKFIVKYDDLLTQPYVVMKNFIDMYGLKFKNIDLNLNVGNAPFSENWNHELIESYKKGELLHLEDKHIKHINSFLDESFINKLGYKKY